MGLGPQTPALDDLLARAGLYVTRYVETFSNVVAEEHYEQELVWVGRLTVTNPNPFLPPIDKPGSSGRRTLRSDLILVNVGPPLEWRPYRDVFEVDGKPVRDRDDRLMKLFLQPTGTAEQQAIRIAQESARFNLSNVGRTLNAPGLALAFLQPAVQPRFHFTLDKRDGDAWIVRYTERVRPTLFRHNSALDNPSTGRFWIDADTGTVVRAEHIVTPDDLKATFTTVFRQDKQYGIAVPAEMREEVTGGPSSKNKLTGRATYSRFRHFEVKTETVRLP
jgi:hypothetical protein